MKFLQKAGIGMALVALLEHLDLLNYLWDFTGMAGEAFSNFVHATTKDYPTESPFIIGAAIIFLLFIVYSYIRA